MSQPDLSFLLKAEQPSAAAPEPEQPTPAVTAEPPEGAVSALIAELRAYQAELES